jgi:acetylglutamate kinase
MMTRVIKIGGNDLDRPDFVRLLAIAVKDLADPVVLVHGGGKEISQLQDRLGMVCALLTKSPSLWCKWYWQGE